MKDCFEKTVSDLRMALKPLGFKIESVERKEGWVPTAGGNFQEDADGGKLNARLARVKREKSEDFEWLNSEGTIIKMVGEAIEELDDGPLLKMGGQFGGLSPIMNAAVVEHGILCAEVSIHFDLLKLRRYLKEKQEKETKVLQQGYGINDYP